MSGFLNKLKRQLLADKKKLGVMIVLAVFGLLLWGRLLLKDVPRTATAQPESSRTSSASPSDKPGQAGAARSRVEVVRVDSRRHLSRDLFNFEPDRYKRTVLSGKQDNFLPEANFDREPTDERLSVTEALERARRLELRSVVTGARPRAVINGRLLAPGDRIDGFELLEVVDRYVHLERNGIVLRLWM